MKKKTKFVNFFFFVGTTKILWQLCSFGHEILKVLKKVFKNLRYYKSFHLKDDFEAELRNVVHQ